MKPLLIFLGLMLSARAGWCDWTGLQVSTIEYTEYPQVRDWYFIGWPESKSKRGVPTTASYVWESTNTWYVQNYPCHYDAGQGENEEKYSLDEFIKSGRFCAWRGKHEWYVDHTGSPCVSGYMCVFCDRCRRRIKVTKEAEEWEP